MARMISYDQLILDAEVRSDLNEAERREVLIFLREFKQEVVTVIEDGMVPPQLKGKIKFRIS